MTEGSIVRSQVVLWDNRTPQRGPLVFWRGSSKMWVQGLILGSD